jgi:GNAT superfamily N-acetyltransferase
VPDPQYPTSWVTEDHLRGGLDVVIRPISPDDAPALQTFHGALSDASIYLRYFAPHPELSEADLRHLTRVDYRDRVALIALDGGEIVGVGRFDRLDEDCAEVAFLVRDDHQGRGLGSALLHHLVHAALDRGISQFVAEVLPQNGRMMTTFAHGGLTLTRSYEDGVVRLVMDLHTSTDAKMSQ